VGEQPPSGDRAEVAAIARAFLDAISSRDVDRIWAMCGNGVVVEWPFTGVCITDLESFRSDIGPVLALLDGLTFTDVEMDRLEGRSEVLLRYRGAATVSTTGKAYRQTYISQLRLQDRKVLLFREYFDRGVLVDALTA
jgi:ketosteroid isomerase-like protein